MKQIVVDMEYLKGKKTLSIALENCEVYEIGTENILDIYCVAKQTDKNAKEYSTDDGFIKISSNAAKTLQYDAIEYPEEKIFSRYCFKERMEMLGGGADMVSFSLDTEKERGAEIYVPYDPLCDILHGGEIELSNCPSFEIDDEGNMIILFGKRSKQPKRKDNNYDEIISGWREAFGDYAPKVLKVKAEILSTFGRKKTNISFSFEICDKKCKNGFAELVFMNCKNISADIYFQQERYCEIVMSKMADGKIYVGFDRLGIDFVCDSVIEYEKYSKKK